MPTRKHPRKKEQKLHDAVFKTFFSDAKVAKNYLLHYTPEGIHRYIDFSVFRKIDTAFVSGRFGISFSDVLYETRLTTGQIARLLFLFEHKSYVPSLPVHLQLLDYLLQIWEDDIKNKRPLSFIIPIVVYHGKKEWEQIPFSDFFRGLPEGWQAFVPNFHYLVTDLSRMPPGAIIDRPKSEFLRNLFLALKFSRDKELTVDNWKKILNFGSPFYQDDRDRILFQTLTLYIVTIFNMSSTDIKALSKKLPKPENSWVDGIPEIFIREWKKQRLKEIRKEVRAEGRAEGRAETIHTFILKTIQKFPGWSDAEVASFVGTTVEYVQHVRQELVGGK
ncbi:MAG: hypothetical protein DYG98_21995 [Haliscomenobacteraceae bacterium CHB4]|nr:hypothetical protein [Haliscomenobacteraceae bacterium CHB4]